MRRHNIVSAKFLLTRKFRLDYAKRGKTMKEFFKPTKLTLTIFFSLTFLLIVTWVLFIFIEINPSFGKFFGIYIFLIMILCSIPLYFFKIIGLRVDTIGPKDFFIHFNPTYLGWALIILTYLVYFYIVAGIVSNIKYRLKETDAIKYILLLVFLLSIIPTIVFSGIFDSKINKIYEEERNCRNLCYGNCDSEHNYVCMHEPEKKGCDYSICTWNNKLHRYISISTGSPSADCEGCTRLSNECNKKLDECKINCLKSC